MLAVNLVGRNETPEELSELLLTHGFSFPTIFFHDSRQDLQAQYGVRAMPTYVIVRDNQMVYRGNLSGAKLWLRQNGVDL